ncbi:MAG: site-specific integrase, partial [Aquabacterium sp.]
MRRPGPAAGAGRSDVPGTDAALIDRFADALWVEDGLAPLTLAAYRRDLAQFS